MQRQDSSYAPRMTIKIVFLNEIKRIPHQDGYVQLCDAIVKAFPGRFPTGFQIKYLDHDGDLITLSNDEDYTMMFEICKQVKLFMVTKEHPDIAPAALISKSIISEAPKDDLLPDLPKEMWPGFEDKQAKSAYQELIEFQEKLEKEMESKRKEIQKLREAFNSVKIELNESKNAKLGVEREILNLKNQKFNIRKSMDSGHYRTEPEIAKAHQDLERIKIQKIALRAELAAFKKNRNELKEKLKAAEEKLDRGLNELKQLEEKLPNEDIAKPWFANPLGGFGDRFGDRIRKFQKLFPGIPTHNIRKILQGHAHKEDHEVSRILARINPF